MIRFSKTVFVVFKLSRFSLFSIDHFESYSSVSYCTHSSVILYAYRVLWPSDLASTATYEGCSNMNASRFITFVTYMLRQNGICFYKGLYVTFKLAPDLKKNTVYLSSCIPLNEGHLSILTNSMLRTYTSDVEERIIL